MQFDRLKYRFLKRFFRGWKNELMMVGTAVSILRMLKMSDRWGRKSVHGSWLKYIESYLTSGTASG